MADLKRILYVEDEADIQQIASMALETIGGFTVEVCSCGREALEAAPKFAPDLILLDVMMPDMDGPGTLKALRQIEQTATTPIIFMTAKVQKHEVEEYKEIGAIAVISKPFDPMKLADMIKEIWEKARD